MRYQIYHKTLYTYNQQVILKTHLLRLRPRSDGWQHLQDFSLSITPEPKGMSNILDLDGNSCIQVWFTHPTDMLLIETHSEIETYQENPFQYLLEPWALNLPIDYPSSLLTQLTPYLQFYSINPDPVAIQLAQEIIQEVNGNTTSFLFTLNQRIYQECEYLTRETGFPWSPSTTWTKKQGSCRDFVVLFMDVCRAAGLAARFVSGYQEGDPDNDERHLHAWAEVYVPGGGWRGYDPTHGLAVSDRHIALVASAKPRYTSPIVGAAMAVNALLEDGQPLNSEMETDIQIIHNSSNSSII